MVPAFPNLSGSEYSSRFTGLPGNNLMLAERDSGFPSRERLLRRRVDHSTIRLVREAEAISPSDCRRSTFRKPRPADLRPISGRS